VACVSDPVGSRGPEDVGVGAPVAGDEAFASWWSPSESLATERPSFTGYPFTLGVASGEPVSSGVVLWTRLAPEPLNGGGVGADPVAVDWEVAEDETFGRVVQRGTVVARAAWAHSVHAEVSGLEPERWYFYRFMAGGEVSPVGRTRTAPAVAGLPQRLRFGLGSCQHFELGYYAAHRHLNAEDLDLMVFVGDYIYEGPGRAGSVRRHVGGEARTLVDYRNRHAQYKTDPDLRSLHAAVPWLVTWDDHEVDNNYAGTRSESLDPDFPRRRAAAYRAYFEHMPLRQRARPRESRMVLRSRRDWGRLARLHLLDGRQRRTPQACPPRGRGGAALIDERCPELHARGRTMLGMPQEGWLTEGLRAVPDRWNIIAQQTLMARARVMVDGHPRVSSDGWDGYPDARGRLLGTLADSGLRSCVVLSGDAHTAFVCDLKRNFDDDQAPVIAAEFCGTSITSPGRPQSRTDAIVRDNPHILYGDSAHRGYCVLDVTPEQCTARLRVIDNPADRQAGVVTAATFLVGAGRPGAQRA
jgi:alkaline phosphatase D